MNTVILAQNDAAAAGALGVFLIFYLAILALVIVSGWKIFTKAGEEGWKVLIPIYNGVVLMQIIGRPVWWVALFFLAIIPIVGTIAVLVLAFIVAIDLAKSFGKDTGFGIGLALLGFVFYPILAFGDARYLGPAGPEPRPGYPNIGGGGAGAYPQQGFAGGYPQQPQQWGQQPQQPQQPQQWGQQPPAPQQPQQWGQQPPAPQQPQQWGQQPPAPEQQQPQQPQQPGWGQPPSDGGYPPPPGS